MPNAIIAALVLGVPTL